MAIRSIHIQAIPHDDQRYPTVGDYMENSPGHWVILVSDTGDWRMNFLIALHEMVELLSTHNKGIEEPKIAAFDIEFEKHNGDSDEEPGDDPNAPYHQDHVFAECLERLLAQQLGVSWKKYDEKLMALWRPKAKTSQ